MRLSKINLAFIPPSTGPGCKLFRGSNTNIWWIRSIGWSLPILMILTWILKTNQVKLIFSDTSHEFMCAPPKLKTINHFLIPETEISLLADGRHFMFTLMRWIYVKVIVCFNQNTLISLFHTFIVSTIKQSRWRSLNAF